MQADEEPPEARREPVGSRNAHVLARRGARGAASASSATSTPVAISCNHQNSVGANDIACAAPASKASPNASPAAHGRSGPPGRGRFMGLLTCRARRTFGQQLSAAGRLTSNQAHGAAARRRTICRTAAARPGASPRCARHAWPPFSWETMPPMVSNARLGQCHVERVVDLRRSSRCRRRACCRRPARRRRCPGVGVVELILDLTDDLFQHVLDGDQAGGVAELVDHDRQVVAVVAELAVQPR